MTWFLYTRLQSTNNSDSFHLQSKQSIPNQTTARPALKADKFLDTRAAMWVKQTTRDLNPTQRADFRWSSAHIWLSRLKVFDCRHSLSQQQLLSRRYVLEFTKIFFSELIDVNWQEFMKVQHGDKMWTTGGEASCSFNTSHHITRARM